MARLDQLILQRKMLEGGGINQTIHTKRDVLRSTVPVGPAPEPVQKNSSLSTDDNPNKSDNNIDYMDPSIPPEKRGRHYHYENRSEQEIELTWKDRLKNWGNSCTDSLCNVGTVIIVLFALIIISFSMIAQLHNKVNTKYSDVIQEVVSVRDELNGQDQEIVKNVSDGFVQVRDVMVEQEKRYLNTQVKLLDRVSDIQQDVLDIRKQVDDNEQNLKDRHSALLKKLNLDEDGNPLGGFTDMFRVFDKPKKEPVKESVKEPVKIKEPATLRDYEELPKRVETTEVKEKKSLWTAPFRFVGKVLTPWTWFRDNK